MYFSILAFSTKAAMSAPGQKQFGRPSQEDNRARKVHPPKQPWEIQTKVKTVIWLSTLECFNPTLSSRSLISFLTLRKRSRKAC